MLLYELNRSQGLSFTGFREIFLFVLISTLIFHSREIPKYPLAYNSIDKNYNVNRESFTGDYLVENGRPRYDYVNIHEFFLYAQMNCFYFPLLIGCYKLIDCNLFKIS